MDSPEKYFHQKNLRCSIVIPAKNEGETIKSTILNIEKILNFNYECLIVVDNLDDTTISEVKMIKPQHSSIKLYYNSDSPGFVGAIKLGISKSNAPVVVIMMADGSDDPQSIPSLVTLVESGFGIGSASRYISGGAQLGGPVIKKFLSRLAGVTFQYFTGCGTNDPTNNFKAYSKAFLLQTTIESKKGFEVGIELVSKAGKTKLAIGEVPTVWIDRSFGDSKFTLIKSFPYYLRWYLYGIINIRN